MKDPMTLPLIRIELSCADGSVIEREWNLAGGVPPAGAMDDAPSFLSNLRKVWDHPQDPITHMADVKPGHEAEARAWVEGLES